VNEPEFDHGRPLDDMPPCPERLQAAALFDVIGRLTARMNGVDYEPDPTVSPEESVNAALHFAAVLLWLEYDWQATLQGWASDIVGLVAEAAGGEGKAGG
jgi:hypothetical protein